MPIAQLHQSVHTDNLMSNSSDVKYICILIIALETTWVWRHRQAIYGRSDESGPVSAPLSTQDRGD